jgi:hypothetical protein
MESSNVGRMNWARRHMIREFCFKISILHVHKEYAKRFLQPSKTNANITVAPQQGANNGSLFLA